MIWQVIKKFNYFEAFFVMKIRIKLRNISGIENNQSAMSIIFFFKYLTKIRLNIIMLAKKCCFSFDNL